jgi:hypothetical protein
MLIDLFLVDPNFRVHLLEFPLEFLDLELHLVYTLRGLCLFLLVHPYLFRELSDQLLILAFVSDLTGLLFKAVHVELLLPGVVELHPHLDLLEPLLDLLFLFLIFYHKANGLLVLPVELFDAGGVFQQLVDLESVHEHDLVDLALLQDIEGIRIGKSQAFDEGLVF